MRKEAVPATDLKFRFARDLHFISQKWAVGLGTLMKPTGLEGQLWFVLDNLSEVPKPATQRAVAERVGISPPTLVRLLDALEQKGLIQRGPVEGDRRANAIRVTPRAEPLLKSISRIAEDWRSEILEDVSQSDLEVCVRVLDKIKSKIVGRTVVRETDLPLASGMVAHR